MLVQRPSKQIWFRNRVFVPFSYDAVAYERLMTTVRWVNVIPEAEINKRVKLGRISCSNSLKLSCLKNEDPIWNKFNNGYENTIMSYFQPGLYDMKLYYVWCMNVDFIALVCISYLQRLVINYFQIYQKFQDFNCLCFFCTYQVWNEISGTPQNCHDYNPFRKYTTFSIILIFLLLLAQYCICNFIILI